MTLLKILLTHLLVLLLAFGDRERGAEASGAAEIPSPSAPTVVLARNGEALLPIFIATAPGADSGSPGTAEALQDLKRCLKRMTGADFRIVEGPFPPSPGVGVYVGAVDDFRNTALQVPRKAGLEEFILRTTGDSKVLLIGGSPQGIPHAIYAFLETLGCRWYFPGDTWEVIPRKPNLSIALNVRGDPDFSLERSIWIGHGIHSEKIRRDYTDWMRRNKMGGPMRIIASHSWCGIDPRKDFDPHPEWFALVDGKRKPNKPCYSHPQVIAKGIQRALEFFRTNPRAGMMSVTPPDGLGFCECDKCKAFSRAAETYSAHGTMFGKTQSGETVSLASETVFNFANRVADAVKKEYPDKYVGVLAYSAYAHPPSFSLHPNIFVKLTRGYRRSPLTQGEQMDQFSKKAHSLGIYEYYDVEQWAWDLPGKARASDLSYHAATLPYYHSKNIRSVRGEMSNNWAPNGLGYYVISRLLWDVKTDVREVEEEFYRKAFGPAAAPMKRFYRRWESHQPFDNRTLALAYRDLKAATELAAANDEYRARVDLIRMYLHFLKNHITPRQGRNHQEDIENWKKKWGEQLAKQKVGYLGDYVSRLMDTHMIHSWAFNRYLVRRGEGLGCETKDWQKPGSIPTPEEIDRLFSEDLKDFAVEDCKEVPSTLFTRRLVPLKRLRPDLVPKAAAPIEIKGFRPKSLYVPVERGQTVEILFATEPGAEVFFISRGDFEKGLADLVRGRSDAAAIRDRTLSLTAPESGYFEVAMTAAPERIGGPAVMIGGKGIRISNARFYFFVPQGTRHFIIRTGAHEGASFVVRNALGKAVFETTRAKRNEFLIDVPQGDDGAVWSFHGPNDINCIARVELIGVPNYFSLLPEQLLVPAEVLGSPPSR